MIELPTPETDALFCRNGYPIEVDSSKAMQLCEKLEQERDWITEKFKLLEGCFKRAERERDEAIARSKEWSDWCVEYKSELEEAQKDTKILSRRMKTLWDSSEKVCRERDELLKECMQMSIEFGLPPTIRPADGEIRKMINGWKQAMVERDEARDANKKLREVLEWIAERYDDSKPMHQVAMDAYEMSCTARAALRKEDAK